MANQNEQIIKDAQYRKGLSIAFFNATNSAISMVSNMKLENSAEALKMVFTLRDTFLEEHKNYYATVIANVGVNYRAETSIAGLKECKTMEDLQTTWRLLSEDERRDGEIIKVAQEIRDKFKNEKA